MIDGLAPTSHWCNIALRPGHGRAHGRGAQSVGGRKGGSRSSAGRAVCWWWCSGGGTRAARAWPRCSWAVGASAAAGGGVAGCHRHHATGTRYPSGRQEVGKREDRLAGGPPFGSDKQAAAASVDPSARSGTDLDRQAGRNAKARALCAVGCRVQGARGRWVGRRQLGSNGSCQEPAAKQHCALPLLRSYHVGCC